MRRLLLVLLFIMLCAGCSIKPFSFAPWVFVIGKPTFIISTQGNKREGKAVKDDLPPPELEPGNDAGENRLPR